MATVEALESGALQEQARKHLWMHFTRMGAFDDEHEIPIIVRGEGCYVYDQHGNRYLDGLVRAVLREHRPRPRGGRPGRRRPGEGARLLHELGLRAPEVDRARRAHRRPRARRPQPRLLHLGRLARRSTPRSSSAASTTSSPATPAATRSSAASSPTTARRWARSRRPASRTRGARSSRCSRARRTSPNTNPYRPEVDDPAEAIRERIEFEGPETVSCVILEPVQNSGGCFVPPPGYFQKVREICDEYGILFISDEVICSWGRLGEYFGAERFGYEPDIITTAKGLTSSYAAMGAVIASDKVFEPFADRHELVPARHHVRRPPGGRRRSRWPTSTCSRTRSCSSNVRAQRGRVRRDARLAARHPDRRRRARAGLLLGDRAGPRPRDEGDVHRGRVRVAAARLPLGEIFKRGLICRADDRGDPVMQLAPPLIAGPGAVRGDPRGAAARARGGVAEARAALSRGAVLLAPRPDPRPRRPPRGGRGGARPARSAGCTSPSSPTRRRGCRAASCCSRRA